MNKLAAVVAAILSCLFSLVFPNAAVPRTREASEAAVASAATGLGERGCATGDAHHPLRLSPPRVPSTFFPENRNPIVAGRKIQEQMLELK